MNLYLRRCRAPLRGPVIDALQSRGREAAEPPFINQLLVQGSSRLIMPALCPPPVFFRVPAIRLFA